MDPVTHADLRNPPPLGEAEENPDADVIVSVKTGDGETKSFHHLAVDARSVVHAGDQYQELATHEVDRFLGGIREVLISEWRRIAAFKLTTRAAPGAPATNVSGEDAEFHGSGET